MRTEPAPRRPDEPGVAPLSEDRLRAALDALPDAVWLLDPVRDDSGRITDFLVADLNRRAALAAGVSADEARGRPMSEVVGTTRRLGHIDRWAAVVESGQPDEMEFRYDPEDGPPGWRWVTASPLGGGVAVTLRDVTERVLAEQRRAASEADYRLLAENATDMIARVTPYGQILYVSPACREILGLEPSEMIGRPDWEFAHRDDVPALLATRDRLDRAPDVRSVTYRARRRRGGWVWLESTARAVRDADGTVMEVQVATRDVSERALADAEHAALHRVSEAVAAGVDDATLYHLVATEMARLLEADGTRVLRFLGDDRAEILGAWRRSALPQVSAGEVITLDHPDGAVSQTRQTGHTAVVDLGATPSSTHGLGFRIAAPVRVNGRLWGAVAAAYQDGSSRPERAPQRVEHFAKLVSLAVANAESRTRLELQATTDALTGLVNHAAFHAALGVAFSRTVRYGRPLSLALIDLDHFKSLNDTFGHRAGDEALVMVGRLMREHARRADVVGRVGGEELAWLMPETGARGAAEATDRLRRAVAAAPVAAQVGLTASVGVARREPADIDAESLFRRADAALFEAKRRGRDRVVSV
jgi:diguanylate cyclase (GGDEF)-like protein/PAS domain S-box-containing protein